MSNRESEKTAPQGEVGAETQGVAQGLENRGRTKKTGRTTWEMAGMDGGWEVGDKSPSRPPDRPHPQVQFPPVLVADRPRRPAGSLDGMAEVAGRMVRPGSWEDRVMDVQGYLERNGTGFQALPIITVGTHVRAFGVAGVVSAVVWNQFTRRKVYTVQPDSAPRGLDGGRVGGFLAHVDDLVVL